MFECNNSVTEFSAFVGDDVRRVAEVENYIKCYSSPALEEVKDDSPVELFGIGFFYLDEEFLQTLVLNARDSIGKLAIREVRSELGGSECKRRRAEINDFFRIILHQIGQLPQCELLEAILTTQRCLPLLVDIIEDVELVSANKMSLVCYEYFHALLEWRWLGLLILFEVQKNEQATAEFTQLYEKLLLCLIKVALWKYSKTKRNELITEIQFYCPCIKKMWIGMMAMSGFKNISDFWTDLQNALEKIQQRNQDDRGFLGQANDLIFQTWLINGIASLFQYRLLDETTFKEKALVNTAADYNILEKIIKEFVQREPSDEQMRIFLLLIKPIYSQWWPIKHEILVLLWEYFIKRLNSSFQMPSESISNLACISRSPTEFIEQARYQASQEVLDSLCLKTSSFKCFIALLAFTLRHYSETSQKTKVQILFNRTIFRITPPKLESMTEQAIYNFALLMLTMLEATPYRDDYTRIAKQLLQLKYENSTTAATVSSTVQRITTIALANTALMIMFSERGFDKSGHIQIFLQNMNEANRKYGERLQPAWHMLAEAMREVYDRSASRGQMDAGDEALLGEWLGKYLKVCSVSERDTLFGCICRVLECIGRAQNFNTEVHAEILQRMYVFVLPIVKDAFTQDTATTLSIAELSANFTLFSTGQLNVPNFLTLFNYFMDNTTANVYLRLHYVKQIIASSRASEIEEKVFIRLWLKFAVLIGRDPQLRDLSQFVCRMSDFGSYCEIPEYDLCDGDEDPIELFFKFAGRKYRDYEGKDSRAQFEMSIQVHALFQHFDKWISSCGLPLLKRIMLILALALKECGSLIYLKSNPTCLYHIAFNQYFLPFGVLTDRNVPNDLILAMGKVWYKIMDALGSMNYLNDPVISDHASNMIVKWVPQFMKFKDKNDSVKPFITFFSSQNEAFVEFAFNRLLFYYVELQTCRPKANSESGLAILLNLLNTLHRIEDNGKIALFIRLMAPAIMDHAMMTPETFASKATANDIVIKMLECTRNNSNLIKMELRSCLATFTRKNLPLETAKYFSFMYKIADQDPAFVESVISTIREELSETERLRGVGEDKHLRRLLMQLEGAVEASFNRQNKS